MSPENTLACREKNKKLLEEVRTNISSSSSSMSFHSDLWCRGDCSNLLTNGNGFRVLLSHLPTWPTHPTHPPGLTYPSDPSTWTHLPTWLIHLVLLSAHLTYQPEYSPDYMIIKHQFPIWPTWYAIGLEQFRNIHKTFFSQFNIGSIDGSVKIIFQVETAQLAAHRWKIKHGQWWWWWLCLLWWLC